MPKQTIDHTGATHHDGDDEGWRDVASQMADWHPDLRAHAVRNLAERGLSHLTDKELVSYAGGWGFFTEHDVSPEVFQVTQDDDLLIDTMLGGRGDMSVTQEPLDAERRETAQDGMRRLFAAAWGFDNEELPTLQEARLRLYELNQPQREAVKNRLYQSGKYLRYQRPKPGTKYHEAFEEEWSGDYLHFGVSSLPDNTPAQDKLDSLMRVYIHAKPEYAGHIAAEVVRRMRTQHNKEIYGKVLDISTATSPNTLQKEDNLLLYLRTHSEMAAAAQVLRELIAERPQVFDFEAGKLDRARKTDIPGVSIAEEPIQQNNVIQESFNSSRENIEAEADRLLTQKFAERYPGNSWANVKQVFQYAYNQGLKDKTELRDMYRQAVQFCAKRHGISAQNYALNARS